MFSKIFERPTGTICNISKWHTVLVLYTETSKPLKSSKKKKQNMFFYQQKMKFVSNLSSGAQFFVIALKYLILNTKCLYYLFYELIINDLG